MSLVTFNAHLRKQRRRLAAVALMVGLAGSVALAHAGPMSDHVGDAAAMCLAVLAVGGAALLAVAGAAGSRARPTFRLLALVEGAEPLLVTHGALRCRAGPAALQVFLR